MKKKIIAILMFAIALTMFAACGPARISQEVSESETESMFVVVETSSLWEIVYHKETRVMYAVSHSMYNHGNFTLLIDADGNPLLWNGRSERVNDEN